MFKNILITITTATIVAFAGAVTASAEESSQASTEGAMTSASSQSDSGADNNNTRKDILSFFDKDYSDDSSNDSMTDYYNDDYYDTDGNATLINNQKIIYNSDEMQFISVTTKDGNVFYVLINYSDSDNIDNVYFLNKVDDYDLYALLYAGNENSSAIDPEAATNAADAATANGRTSDSSTTSEVGSVDSASSGSINKSATSGMMKNLMILGGAVVIGGLVFVVLLKSKKKNKPSVPNDTFDDFEDDDDNEINEDTE